MKKIISLAAIFCICICSLLSCSKITNDPIEMAQKLNEADYFVEVVADASEIEDFADEFDIKCNGVYCIIYAEPEDDEEKSGFFIFCEKKGVAKDIEADVNELLEDDFEDYFIRGTVERKGKVVYVGSEDVLDDLK